MKLKDRVALITGSSTGIGAATAQLFAEEGAISVINYPNKSEADNAARIVKSIKDAGGRSMALQADVSNWDEVGTMVATIKDKLGRIDILMNNAGVNSYKTLDEVTLEEWNKTIAVSLTGVFICVKHVIPIMVAQNVGNIINIASIAPWYAGKTVDYNAAKSGVLAITRTIAKHYGRNGIRANTIAPGFHRTEMGESVRKRIGVSYLDSIPVGFTPGPESLAKVALFLASDDSHYIDGHTLVSDGGVTLR
jgi:3-oxoacyl-[acyl-carrier protein] reductase